MSEVTTELQTFAHHTLLLSSSDYFKIFRIFDNRCIIAIFYLGLAFLTNKIFSNESPSILHIIVKAASVKK